MAIFKANILKNFKKFVRFFGINKRPLLFCILFGSLLCSLIEILGRHSFVSFAEFVIDNPFKFVYNALIVVFTLTLSLLVKRRIFAIALISAAWLTLGVANCVLLTVRITPLNVSDFRIILDAFNIIGLYLNPFQIALIIVGFIIADILLVLMWRKTPKYSRSFARSLTSIFCIFCGLFVMTGIGVYSSELPEDIDSLDSAYDENGFVYGFAMTVLDRGIGQPDDYSAENMEQLCMWLGTSDDEPVESDANIVFVQLESVFDTARLSGFEASADPMPNYTALKDRFTSGLLTVPSVGAGTANTEFEVLTGMTTDCFGAGEYPYYTVLGEKTCESLAYIARAAGMTAHAIHNNDGAFYDRNTVYDRLGFNTYTSLEYMRGVEYNKTDWAEDAVLNTVITDALDSTDGFDFVFAVTVAAHGAYPDDIAPDGLLKVDCTDDESRRAQFEYYINELRKVDDFIGKLIADIENRGEKTIVVLYGDHIPALDLDDERFITGNSHTTEYVICDNFGLTENDRDLCAYHLSAAVTSRLGLTGGPVNTLSRVMLASDSPFASAYLDALTLIQYDMLYGDAVCDKNTKITRTSDFKMSIYPLTAESAAYIVGENESADTLVVCGEGFTEFSRVIIGGSEHDTVFVNENTLCVPDVRLFNLDDTVTVGQFNESGKLLSESEPCDITVK